MDVRQWFSPLTRRDCNEWKWMTQLNMVCKLAAAAVIVLLLHMGKEKEEDEEEEKDTSRLFLFASSLAL